MMRFKRSFAMVLAILLLCVGSACSNAGSFSASSGSQTKPNKGLPVLYIDGKAYPITAEDGIKGLETISDGVYASSSPLRRIQNDEYIIIDRYRFYGVAEEEIKETSKKPDIWLSYYGEPGWRTNSSTTYYQLVVEAEAAPFQNTKLDRASEFSELMEKNGFILLNRDYCRFYTENGPLDPKSEAFEDRMREYLRTSKDYEPKWNDTEWQENTVKSHPPGLTYTVGGFEILRELEENKTRIGCILLVSRDEKTGAIHTTVKFIAREAVIENWFRQWAPAFGKKIAPTV